MVANRYRLFDETNIYLKYSITLGERDSITKSRQITSPHEPISRELAIQIIQLRKRAQMEPYVSDYV